MANMIHDIPKPKLSPDFTVEDIHKIREWNYARFKDTTITERLACYRQETAEALQEIERLRKSRQRAHAE
jgi:hypothetical protein